MRGGGILNAHVFMGVFSLFAVSFAQVLCYNIKLTDYEIIVNQLNDAEPKQVCWMCISTITGLIREVPE